MKKIYILLLAAIALVSCSVERRPEYMMEEETMNKNIEESFPALLNGCYGYLKTWSDPMYRCGEYAGDNMMIRGTSTDAFYEFISYSRTPNNYRLQNFWDYSYKVIAQASNIIKAIPEGKNAITDTQLGECYYLRGMIYFYLCRAYGRPYAQSPETNLGLPIVNGTPADPANTVLPKRSTVKETYEQAINDLEKAATLMTQELHEGEKCIFASKEAAWAMLSRIYLYMSGTYETPNTTYAQKSVEYATKVIDSGKFKLLSRDDYGKSNTLEPENNTENIFVVKRVEAEFPGWDYYYTIGGMYSNIGGMGWGEMYASAKYLDLLNETGQNDWFNKKYTDIRAQFIEPQYVKNDTTKFTPMFRFIKNVYDASGTQVNFNYVQLPYVRLKDGNLACDSSGMKKKNLIPLTPIDATQRLYSINYDGKTYRGVLDYEMALNRVYPMFYVVKCSRQGGKENQLYSPIVSRLDEMYLNRAEANVKLGNIAKAMADVNIIRERSIVGGSYTAAQFNATTAKALVDKERQLELAFQAERSYDVFRNGDALTRRFPGPHQPMQDVSATDYRVIYFIPQSAINAYNGVLEQNPKSN